MIFIVVIGLGVCARNFSNGFRDPLHWWMVGCRWGGITCRCGGWDWGIGGVGLEVVTIDPVYLKNSLSQVDAMAAYP